MKKIYVSGASGEMARSKAMMELIRCTDGLSITHDWTKSFDGPKVAEEDLEPRLRRQFVEEDVQGVRDADIVWLLAPGNREAPQQTKSLYTTKGAWFELGAADMHRRVYGTPTIIVSGSERYQSIFTEVASHFFETDEEALAWLRTIRWPE